MNIKKYSKSSSFFDILLLLMAAVFCTPILGSIRNFIIVCLLIAAYIIMKNKSIYTRSNTILVNSVLLYVIVIFGYKFIGFSSAAWGNYMHQLSFFVILLLMALVIKKKSIRPNSVFLWAIFLIIAFNVVDNIRLSILYPQINTGRLYMDEELLASINAGGTRFYTFSLFFFMVCYFVFLNCKQKKIRFLMLTCALITAIYISAFCLKASVVVYFLISIIFLFYAKKTKRKKVFFMVLGITALMLFIIVSFFEETIINFIVSISPDERLSTRLVTLINPEDEEAQIGTLTGRTKLYMLSIETWLSDIGPFLFGIGDQRVAFGAVATGIGQHADLLDSLARYGLLGLMLLFLIFKYAFQKLLSVFDEEYKLQIICIIIVFLLCGLTKGIFFPSSGFVIFLLLPLTAELVNSKER